MLKKCLKGKKGFTLVELVVTFALLAIFCVSIVQVIGSSLSIFEKASEHSRVQSVSQTLLDKISGEIGGAQTGTARGYGVTVSDGTTGGGYLDFGPGECIAFCSRTGSQVYISTVDGYLNIHYRPVTDGRQLHAVDWDYDPGVYNGFKIQSLTFSIATQNVIKIELILVSDSTGFTYASERFAQCFNFSDAALASNISNGPIIQDAAG